MNNLIYLGIASESAQPVDMQCIVFCFDELRDKGIIFPQDMQPGERRLMLESDSLRITLYLDYQNNYQFIYNSIAAGRGTQFSSAKFKLHNDMYSIITSGEACQSEIQCIHLCMCELYNIGFRFPRNMCQGETRTLLNNDSMKVVLRRHNRDTYQFFYHSIVDGCETPFPSACFKVEHF